MEEWNEKSVGVFICVSIDLLLLKVMVYRCWNGAAEKKEGITQYKEWEWTEDTQYTDHTDLPGTMAIIKESQCCGVKKDMEVKVFLAQNLAKSTKKYNSSPYFSIARFMHAYNVTIFISHIVSLPYSPHSLTHSHTRMITGIRNHIFLPAYILTEQNREETLQPPHLIITDHGVKALLALCIRKICSNPDGITTTDWKLIKAPARLDIQARGRSVQTISLYEFPTSSLGFAHQSYYGKKTRK